MPSKVATNDAKLKGDYPEMTVFQVREVYNLMTYGISIWACTVVSTICLSNCWENYVSDMVPPRLLITVKKTKKNVLRPEDVRVVCWPLFTSLTDIYSILMCYNVLYIYICYICNIYMIYLMLYIYIHYMIYIYII